MLEARGEQRELADMQPQAGMREVEAAVFQMTSDLGKLKRRIDMLGTPRDTTQHREELATLNRSVQARAKDIKQHLESLSVARSELPEPAQAKLRKLLQDFAATLQDYKAAQRVAADKEARFLPRAPAAAAVATTAAAAAASNAAAAGSSGAEADIESQALLQEQALAERRALDSTVAFQEALIEERDQGIAEIQRQIGEVNEMFQDLAVLINDQGQQLTTIDTHIASTAERTREGAAQLIRAERSQRAARNKCLWLWLAAGAVLAIIIVVLFA